MHILRKNGTWKQRVSDLYLCRPPPIPHSLPSLTCHGRLAPVYPWVQFAFSEWNTTESQCLRQYTDMSEGRSSERFANTHTKAGGTGADDPELAFCCETCVTRGESQGYLKVECHLCCMVPRKEKLIRNQGTFVNVAAHTRARTRAHHLCSVRVLRSSPACRSSR